MFPVLGRYAHRATPHVRLANRARVFFPERVRCFLPSAARASSHWPPPPTNCARGSGSRLSDVFPSCISAIRDDGNSVGALGAISRTELVPVLHGHRRQGLATDHAPWKRVQVNHGRAPTRG